METDFFLAHEKEYDLTVFDMHKIDYRYFFKCSILESALGENHFSNALGCYVQFSLHGCHNFEC